MATALAPKIEVVGHWFTPEKEEVYVAATMTLPRVGEVTWKYIASRYKVRQFDSDGGNSRNAWSDWRVTKSSSLPTGVGPKTADAAMEAVEPEIFTWIASDAHKPSLQKAIGKYVGREARDSRYGYTRYTHAEGLLAKYKREIAKSDYDRISKALSLLKQAAELLKDED